jgi:hypothetical protein
MQKEELKAVVAMEWKEGRTIPGVCFGKGSHLWYFSLTGDDANRAYLSEGDWIVAGVGRVKKDSFEKFFRSKIVVEDEKQGVCVLGL